MTNTFLPLHFPIHKAHGTHDVIVSAQEINDQEG